MFNQRRCGAVAKNLKLQTTIIRDGKTGCNCLPWATVERVRLLAA